MELVVRKNDLLRELQLFQGIVERKNTIPILANVLIDANGSQVRLLATDLEVALRSTCSASVAKSGSLTLPAKKLYEIIKALPETDVRILEDKNGVKVAADRFDSRLQTLPREDFPALPEGGGTITAALPAASLKEMVGKTQFAITGEDTRYFLNGAQFVLRPDSMSLVATDGHRLALVTVKRAGKKDEAENKVILPKKTLSELSRLLSECGDVEVKYQRGENHLFFDVGGNSLQLIYLHHRLRGIAGEQLHIVDLFRWPTVATLAAHMERLRADVQLPDMAAARAAARGAARRARALGEVVDARR